MYKVERKFIVTLAGTAMPEQSANSARQLSLSGIHCAGYDAQTIRDNDGGDESQAQSEQTHFRRLLRNTVLALALGMPLMVFSMLVPHVDLSWTPLRGLWLAVGLATLAVLTIRRWAFFPRRWQRHCECIVRRWTL